MKPDSPGILYPHASVSLRTPPNSGIIDTCATMPNIFNMFWKVQSWWSVTDLFSFVAHASMLYKNSLPSTVIKVCTIFPSRCLTGLAPTLTSLIYFELVFRHAMWSNLNLFPCLYPVFPALFAENIILSPHNGVDTLWKSVSKRCLSSLLLFHSWIWLSGQCELACLALLCGKF